MNFEYIRIEKSFEGRVANLVIDRQEKMNSMTVAMRQEIGQAFTDFSHDDQLRVVVVHGAGGKAFSSGGDVEEFLKLEPHELVAWGEEMTEIERCPKPVIAAIDGYCFGAGMELALSCDIRVATDRSLLGMPSLGHARSQSRYDSWKRWVSASTQNPGNGPKQIPIDDRKPPCCREGRTLGPHKPMRLTRQTGGND
jgi:hypothetical protein